MKKPVIAVDLDDVLASSAQGYVDYSNKRWGTHLKVEDYQENFAKMWMIDHGEAFERVAELYKTGMQLNFKRFDEATGILKKLSQSYKLIIITSRRKIIEAETLTWLDEHFNGIFDEVYFSGIWELNSGKKFNIDVRNQITKADTLKSIAASYLIDDQVKHCQAAARAGVPALLYGEYTWNQADRLPRLVTRVKDWQEIEKYFDERG